MSLPSRILVRWIRLCRCRDCRRGVHLLGFALLLGSTRACWWRFWMLRLVWSVLDLGVSRVWDFGYLGRNSRFDQSDATFAITVEFPFAPAAREDLGFYHWWCIWCDVSFGRIRSWSVDLLITETTCLACSGVVTRNPGGTGSLNCIVLALRVPCMNGYLTSCSSLCEWCSSRFNRRTCALMGAWCWTIVKTLFKITATLYKPVGRCAWWNAR